MSNYMNFTDIIAAIFGADSIDPSPNSVQFNNLTNSLRKFVGTAGKLSQDILDDLAQVELHPTGAELMRQAIAAQRDATSTKESQEFIKTLCFITNTLFNQELGAYNRKVLALNYENINLMISKLNKITDAKLQLKLIKYLISGLEYTIKHDLASASFGADNTWDTLNILALNNEYATLDDYFHYLKHANRNAKNRKQVLSDMARTAQTTIEKELASNSPSAGKIKDICANVQDCLQDNSEFAQLLRQKFDANKILATPDIDYMARFDMDVGGRIDEVMKTNQQLTQQNQQITTNIKNAEAEVVAAQNKQAMAEAELAQTRNELERLKAEIATLSKEKASAESAFLAARKNIEKMATSAAKTRSSLLSQGVKKHRAMVADILKQTTENKM